MAVMHRAVSRIGSATSDDADIDSPIGNPLHAPGMTHGVTPHRCESEPWIRSSRLGLPASPPPLNRQRAQPRRLRPPLPTPLPPRPTPPFKELAARAAPKSTKPLSSAHVAGSK